MLKTNKLCAYIPFEGDGNDYSGLNNHLTANGTVTYESGSFGKRALYGTNTSGMRKTSGTSGIGGQSELTLSMWIKAGGTGTYQELFAGNNTVAGYIEFAMTDTRTKLRGYIHDGSTYSDSYCNYTFTSGTWYHVAMVWKRSWGSGTGATETNKRYKFYVNGVDISSNTRSNNYTNDPTQVVSINNKIGVCMDSNASPGYSTQGVDEFLSFNTALTSNDIKRIYLGLHPIES